MTVSHVHCQVKDLPGAAAWFTTIFGVSASFSDARMGVFQIDGFTVILDAASNDSAVTIGFSSSDCDADFNSLVAKGAHAIEAPADRPYGARAAYLQGPGAIKIEIEQLLSA
jgi:predicted enzyme related to lactoylglutathione lyase